jgi:D-sedoheptulose 7-phosphate isomerase/D-glycero-D-manno-heptose 1,7-bisphosphate phosphatase
MLPQVQSLSSNMSLLTAIANDIGYEKVFSYQLNMKANEGDVLVVVSSSGNSLNIIDALRCAKLKKLSTIALVGFDGGQALNLADIGLHVKNNNYGVVEDAHQAIMHIMAQAIRLSYLNSNTIKL